MNNLWQWKITCYFCKTEVIFSYCPVFRAVALLVDRLKQDQTTHDRSSVRLNKSFVTHNTEHIYIASWEDVFAFVMAGTRDEPLGLQNVQHYMFQ